ncbi:hypothetical protein FCIRC_12059 [Fusarium circinatum]|uniref:ZN622/Rei1/Reh1 zinc finger C2H2-type domain-containing protein n=1 Tax=Fusarium circinatum TaxID=48490 RepID=A0A8H5SX87_FUSCI|nr:hypothetical protein FCIRC_12059 [Fusarium circinatum]
MLTKFGAALRIWNPKAMRNPIKIACSAHQPRSSNTINKNITRSEPSESIDSAFIFNTRLLSLMLGATTTTATTTTSSMTLLLSQETSPLTPYIMSINESASAPQSFTPGQCLFCPSVYPTLAESIIHMQTSHGLFVPYKQHLLVDLETLLRYIHLVIYEYRECIHCGTSRTTVQAVQQHMMGRGHCKFDVSDESEFADFYDFSRQHLDTDDDVLSEDNEESESEEVKPDQKLVQTDRDSIRLPSGRLISKKSSAQVEPSISQLRKHKKTARSQLEYFSVEVDEDAPLHEEYEPDISDTRLLSRRERRQKATVTYQLANLSAGDRSALMHLSASEQRSFIATQHRFTEKVQKEESRRQRRIDRKGNKNLYAYWNTETPVYQCG